MPPPNPLLFTIPSFTKKVPPFVCLLLKNGIPFTYLVWNFASLLAAVNASVSSFTDPNDRFPYPFEYLKPEKDTPFERSLPV